MRMVDGRALRRHARCLERHAIIAAGLVLASCGGSESDRAATVDAGQLADGSADGGSPQLSGGTFDFWIDRECSRATASPDDPIPETDYAPVPREARYRVVFSADAGQVALRPLLAEGGTFGGHLSESDANRYELDAFAGGRFVVSPRTAPIGAELVVYGSGVPVVSCEKGLLVPLGR